MHRVTCRSADDPQFQRRIYRLLNKGLRPLVLVHYRLVPSNSCDDVSKSTRRVQVLFLP